MVEARKLLERGRPLVVGSIGGMQALLDTTAEQARVACDVVELRLDHLRQAPPESWSHLRKMPLLFTARRIEEGGAKDCPQEQRCAMMEAVLDEASLIDIEVASIPQMTRLIDQLKERDIPWIASFHDFTQLPDDQLIESELERAKAAGAACFKVAATLDGPGSMARLARFQMRNHGMAVASMGMGPLAPVSRLLCAQAGSLLNFGYLGSQPTAPGQWDARSLKEAMARLAPLS